MKEIKTKFWIEDEVTIGGTIPARVTGLMVKSSGIEYQCSYFYEGNYYTCYVYDFEMHPKESTEGRIGFNDN